MGFQQHLRAVTVTWNANPESDIAGYRLFWGETNASPAVRDVGKTTQAQVTNLVAGRTYRFYLTAYNTAGLESDPSSSINYTESQQLQLPAAPSNLAGVADSSTQIRVQWRDNSTNETGFRLLRKVGVSGTYSTIPLAANTTNYTDSNLTAATQYFYKVHAYNSAGNSADTTEISVTTQSGPPPVSVTTTASYVRQDLTTSGFWRGAYGKNGGLASPSGNVVAPDYVRISGSGNYPLTWAATTTDTRALQKSTGTSHFAGAWHSTNSFDLYLRFTNSATYQVSFYFVDFDRQGRTQLLELFELGTGKTLGAEMISNFENGRYSTWDLRGNVGVRLTAIAGPNAVLSGVFFDPVGAGTASFVASDTATSGSWIGQYGSEGGITYPGGQIAVPPYVSVSGYKNYPLSWSSSTTDLRALQKSGGSDRFAGAWHGTNDFYMMLQFNDGATHQVSFYFVDYDRAGREQNLEILDSATGNRLDAATISDFGNGVWISYNLSGRITLRFSRIAGPNAVLSGMFFDLPGANHAEFVDADTSTSGSWIGAYGGDGHAIATQSPSLPSYATVTFSGANAGYWAQTTSDTTALQLPSGNGRVASAWVTDRQFSANIKLTDGRPHAVSMYFVDFNNQGRKQLVEIIDSRSGIVLDSTEVSAFRSGIWLSYDVLGEVTVRVTSLNGFTPVMSGVFFD